MVRFGVIFILSWIVYVHSIHTLVKDKANTIKPKKEIQVIPRNVVQRAKQFEKYTRIRSPVGIFDRPNVRARSWREFSRGTNILSDRRNYPPSGPLDHSLDRRPLRSRSRVRSNQYRRFPSENLPRRQDQNRQIRRLRPYNNYNNRNGYEVLDNLPRRVDSESDRNAIYRLDRHNEPLLLDSKANNKQEARNTQVIERSRTLRRQSLHRLQPDRSRDLVRIQDTDRPVGSLSKRPMTRAEMSDYARSQFLNEKNGVHTDGPVTRTIPIPVPRRIPLHQTVNRIASPRHFLKPTNKLSNNVKVPRKLEVVVATNPLDTIRPIPKPSDVLPILESTSTKQTHEQGLSLPQPEHVIEFKKEMDTLNSIAKLSLDPVIQAAKDVASIVTSTSTKQKKEQRQIHAPPQLEHANEVIKGKISLDTAIQAASNIAPLVTSADNKQTKEQGQLSPQLEHANEFLKDKLSLDTAIQATGDIVPIVTSTDSKQTKEQGQFSSQSDHAIEFIKGKLSLDTAIQAANDIVPIVTSTSTKQTKEQGQPSHQQDHANERKREKGALNSIARLSPDPTIQAALKMLIPLLTRAAAQQARRKRPKEIIKSKSPKRIIADKSFIQKEPLDVIPLNIFKLTERAFKGKDQVPGFRVKPSNKIKEHAKSESLVVRNELVRMLEHSTVGHFSHNTTRPHKRRTDSKASVVNTLSDVRKPPTRTFDKSKEITRSRQRAVFYGEEMEEMPSLGHSLHGSNGMSGLSRLLSMYSSNKEAEENPPPKSFANISSSSDLLRYFRSIGTEEISTEMSKHGKGGYPQKSRQIGYVPRDKSIHFNEKMMGEIEMPEMFANMFINSNIHIEKEFENIPKTETNKSPQQVHFIRLGESLVPIPVTILPKTIDSTKEIQNTDRNKLKRVNIETKLDSLLRAKSSIPKSNIEGKVEAKSNRNQTGAYLQNLPTSEIIKMLIRELAKLVV